MIEQQLFLGGLTEQEYRYWLDNVVVKNLSPGETLIAEDDFPTFISCYAVNLRCVVGNVRQVLLDWMSFLQDG